MMVISSKTYFLPVSFQNIKVLDYSSCQITIICLLHRLQNKSRVKQVECYCGRKQEVQRELRRHHQRNEHLCNRYGRSRNVPGICTLSQWYQILILYYLFSLKDNSVTSTFVNNSYYRVTVEARFNIKKKDPGSRKVLLVSGHRQDVELDILMATAA